MLSILSIFFLLNPFLQWGACAWQFHNNAFSFTVGVVLASIEYGLQRDDKNKLVKFARAIKIPLFVVASVMLILFDLVQITEFQISALTVFVVVFLFASFIRRKRMLLIIGTSSYYMYLIEGKLFMILDEAYDKMNVQNVFFKALVYLILLTILIFVINLYSKQMAALKE